MKTKMESVISSKGLCEYAKTAFEYGMRDGANHGGKLRVAWKAITLFDDAPKGQRKVLRRVYQAAFKFSEANRQ